MRSSRIVRTPPQLEVEAMNDYEKKQQARRERLEAAAASTVAASNAACAQARRMADAIPGGQPILVGHHSEGRDRRYRAKIGTKMDQAVALSRKAEELARRAESVGTGGISSDDPDAVTKLQQQLADAQSSQAAMKAVNAAIRKHRDDKPAQLQALQGLGWSAERAEKMLEPDFAGRVGFPAFALSNNNANIKRIEQRIAELQALRDRADKEEAGDGYTYREDTAENRVMFIFDGKPDPAVRDLLKREAFKWSPSREAWVRQLTPNAIAAAARVRRQL